MSLTQYYTATTLDGFIADPDNSLEWLFVQKGDPDAPLGYHEFITGGRDNRNWAGYAVTDAIRVSRCQPRDVSIRTS